MTSSQDPRETAIAAALEMHAVEEYQRLEGAAALAESETAESELRVLVAAREHLRMDLAYCSHLTAVEQVVQRAQGDARSFGMQPGTTIALGDTYCQRVLDGRLPNLIPDTSRDERVAGLSPKVGSYAGVPVSFSDGHLYGTLCCASHASTPSLGEGDVAFLRVLARMLANEIERGEIESAANEHRNQAVVLGALFAGLDARDDYSGRHSKAVVSLSVRVARELGLSEGFVAEVTQVALLHDIGKLGIPDAILAKPGPLDEAEWEIMQAHPVVGAQIVASIATLAPLAPAIRAGGERYDGKGHPDGLTCEQIPLASRITCACDAHDAMLSSRPYRNKPMKTAAAAAELRTNAGTQFDPTVVDALLRVVGR